MNNNINQQNANHQRRNSCSPPLTKNHQQDVSNSVKSINLDFRKLERSASEPDRRAVQSNSSRYKTELCRPFEENGTCKYGDKCQFAHGMKELRSMARHPKYKTELCRTFHSTGLCPYGPRCHFIHNSEEAKKNLFNKLTSRASQSAPGTKPEALNSLGSVGDISPVSSHGGTPTGLKSFDDLYQMTPLSPTVNNVFTFSQDIANLVVNNLNQGFSRDYRTEICAFNDGIMSTPDISVDNFNFNFPGSPVLELIKTPPLTPTLIDGNDSHIRLPIFDLFHN